MAQSGSVAQQKAFMVIRQKLPMAYLRTVNDEKPHGK